jgi:chemotaxis protein methyltransferase CheR
MLANRLRKRLRALRLTTYDEYCGVLHSAQGPDEIEQLVDLISTNHTRFFREPEHFSFLIGRILPDLVSRLGAEGSSLRIWCAAASQRNLHAVVLAGSISLGGPGGWQIRLGYLASCSTR